MARVPRSESTRDELKQMSGGRGEAVAARSCGRRHVLSSRGAGGRGGAGTRTRYYAHSAGNRGYRNGYRTDRVKSAEGMIEFAVAAGERHGRAVSQRTASGPTPEEDGRLW
jgi:hypothetical protein